MKQRRKERAVDFLLYQTRCLGPMRITVKSAVLLGIAGKRKSKRLKKRAKKKKRERKIQRKKKQ